MKKGKKSIKYKFHDTFEVLEFCILHLFLKLTKI